MAYPSEKITAIAAYLKEAAQYSKVVGEKAFCVRQDLRDYKEGRIDEAELLQAINSTIENNEREREFLNKALAVCGHSQMTLFSEEYFKKNKTLKLPDPSQITIDTDLGFAIGSGWLLPRVGRAACLAAIKDKKPRGNYDWLSATDANRCFGFGGTQANFLLNWMSVHYYSNSQKVVETYGSIVYNAEMNRFTWSGINLFANTYYSMFYVRQAKLRCEGKRMFEKKDGTLFLIPQT